MKERKEGRREDRSSFPQTCLAMEDQGSIFGRRILEIEMDWYFNLFFRIGIYRLLIKHLANITMCKVQGVVPKVNRQMEAQSPEASSSKQISHRGI